MTDDAARTLIGRSVCTDGVRLGTVSAVWLDAKDAVLGMEVTSSWSETTHYLPFAAASIGDGVVRASSLAILRTGPVAFFAEQGARRVPAAEKPGFGSASAW